MLLQLRVTVPPDRTDAVRALFGETRGTAHLAVLPGASVAVAAIAIINDSAILTIGATVLGPEFGPLAGLALGGGEQFARAATQLGINVVGILTAAIATLAAQWALWRQVPRSVPRPDQLPQHPGRT